MPDGMRESKKLTRKELFEKCERLEERNRAIYVKYDEICKEVAGLLANAFFSLKLAVKVKREIEAALVPTHEILQVAVKGFMTICGFNHQAATNFLEAVDLPVDPTALAMPVGMRDERIADSSIPLPPESTSDKLQIVYQEDIDKEKADAEEEEST